MGLGTQRFRQQPKATSNLEAAEAEALRLGARKAANQPAPDRWRVLFDPAGHPFCFTTQIPE